MVYLETKANQYKYYMLGVVALIVVYAYYSFHSSPGSKSVFKTDAFATTNRPNSYKAAGGEALNINVDSTVKVLNSVYFERLLSNAKESPRKRKMTDLTKDPKSNSMQVLVNTWTEGSYSPVHRHNEYSEVFTVLEGALAFFTFTESGEVTCNVLCSGGSHHDRAIIVEAKQYHAMTAAPMALGYPGHAVIFEVSGHTFNPSKPTKSLAPFAPSLNDGLDGDPEYFAKILKQCPEYKK